VRERAPTAAIADASENIAAPPLRASPDLHGIPCAAAPALAINNESRVATAIVR
jgi:hypothetical protein